MDSKFNVGDKVIPKDKPLDSGGRPNIKVIEYVGFMCGIYPIYHLEGDIITYSEDELFIV